MYFSMTSVKLKSGMKEKKALQDFEVYSFTYLRFKFDELLIDTSSFKQFFVLFLFPCFMIVKRVAGCRNQELLINIILVFPANSSQH